jgi:dsRNA-specific ribonuclease
LLQHLNQFSVAVYLNGKLAGEGIGSSKKRAEQDAARAAIEKLYPNN